MAVLIALQSKERYFDRTTIALPCGKHKFYRSHIVDESRSLLFFESFGFIPWHALITVFCGSNSSQIKKEPKLVHSIY